MSGGDFIRKSLEEQERRKKVESKLNEISSISSYDESTCQLILETTIIFSKTGPKSFTNYKSLFKKLSKVLSKTILTSHWMNKFKVIWREKISSALESLKAHFNVDISKYSEELENIKQIQSLLVDKCWLKPQITLITKPGNIDDKAKREKFGTLLEEEGWKIIEYRLEALSSLNIPVPTALSHFLEATLLKSTEILNGANKNSELTEEKYFQFLTFFIVVLSRLSQNGENKHYRRLIKFLPTSAPLLQVLKKILSPESDKINPSCKFWEFDPSLASDLIYLFLTENETESDTEMKKVFTLWLHYSYYSKKSTVEEFLGTLNGNEINFKVNLNEYSKDLNEIVPDKLDELIKVIKRNSLVYAFADSIKEAYGESRPVLKRVLEMYITRLTPEVSRTLVLRDKAPSSPELLSTSTHLSFAFLSLSTYFAPNPQVHFELLLSAFSLCPTPELLQKLIQIVEYPFGIVSLTTKLSNVHNVGLPAELWADFLNVLHSARFNRLSCFRDDWDKFRALLQKHLETKGSDIKGLNDLSLAKPTDYSLYAGLRKGYDENDLGYEGGYEPVLGEEEPEEVEIELGKKPKVKFREPRFRMQQLLKKKSRDAALSAKSKEKVSKTTKKVEKVLKVNSSASESETSISEKMSIKKKYALLSPEEKLERSRAASRRYMEKKRLEREKNNPNVKTYSSKDSKAENNAQNIEETKPETAQTKEFNALLSSHSSNSQSQTAPVIQTDSNKQTPNDIKPSIVPTALNTQNALVVPTETPSNVVNGGVLEPVKTGRKKSTDGTKSPVSILKKPKTVPIKNENNTGEGSPVKIERRGRPRKTVTYAELSGSAESSPERPFKVPKIEAKKSVSPQSQDEKDSSKSLSESTQKSEELLKKELLQKIEIIPDSSSSESSKTPKKRVFRKNSTDSTKQWPQAETTFVYNNEVWFVPLPMPFPVEPSQVENDCQRKLMELPYHESESLAFFNRSTRNLLTREEILKLNGRIRLDIDAVLTNEEPEFMLPCYSNQPEAWLKYLNS